MVVPVIIVAAAIYSRVPALGPDGTLTGLVVGAYAADSCHTCWRACSTALETVDRRLEEAAMTLGAAPWSVFRRVTLPLILPGVLSGLLFALVVSFDELVVSIFISTTQVRPVTVQMWSDVRGDVDPTISAIGDLAVPGLVDRRSQSSMGCGGVASGVWTASQHDCRQAARTAALAEGVRRHDGGGWDRPCGAARRVRHAARAVRLGQDDDADDDRRAGASRQRARSCWTDGRSDRLPP